jgi:hypothetical protein
MSLSNATGEGSGISFRVKQFNRWYYAACDRINAQLRVHDGAVAALRATQRGAVTRITIQPRQQERRKRSPQKQYPQEFLDSVDALMRQQMSQREIGEALQISRTTVRAVCKQIKARAGDKTDAGKTTMTTSNANVDAGTAPVNQETP